MGEQSVTHCVLIKYSGLDSNNFNHRTETIKRGKEMQNDLNNYFMKGKHLLLVSMSPFGDISS